MIQVESALNARRTHRHRFGAQLASVIGRLRPRISGGFDDDCFDGVIGEQDFITAAALHLLGGFLLLGTFDDHADSQGEEPLKVFSIAVDRGMVCE